MKPVLALLTALVLTGCAHAYACKGFPQFSACKSATQAYRSTNKAGPPESTGEPFHEEAERLLVPAPSLLKLNLDAGTWGMPSPGSSSPRPPSGGQRPAYTPGQGGSGWISPLCDLAGAKTPPCRGSGLPRTLVLKET